MADLDIPIGGVLVNGTYLHRRQTVPQPISQAASRQPGVLIHAYASTFNGPHLKVDDTGDCRITIIDALSGSKREVLFEVCEIAPDRSGPSVLRTPENLVFASCSRDELPSYKIWYDPATMARINPPPLRSVGELMDRAVAAHRLKELKAQTTTDSEKLQLFDTVPDALYADRRAFFMAVLVDYRQAKAANSQVLPMSVLEQHFTHPQMLLLFPTLDMGGALDLIQKANKVRYEESIKPEGLYAGAVDNLCTKLTMLHFGLPIAPITLENMRRAGINSDAPDPPDAEQKPMTHGSQPWTTQALEFLNTYHERRHAHGGLRIPRSKNANAMPTYEYATDTATHAVPSGQSAPMHIRGGDSEYVDDDESIDDATISELSNGDVPTDDAYDELYDVSDDSVPRRPKVPRMTRTRAGIRHIAPPLEQSRRQVTRHPAISVASQTPSSVRPDASASSRLAILRHHNINHPAATAPDNQFILPSAQPRTVKGKSRYEINDEITAKLMQDKIASIEKLSTTKRPIMDHTETEGPPSKRRGIPKEPVLGPTDIAITGPSDESTLEFMLWNERCLKTRQRAQERIDAYTSAQSILKKDGNHEIPFLGETLEHKISAGSAMPTIYVAPVTAGFNVKLTEQLRKAHNVILRRAIPCLICNQEFPVTQDYDKEVLAHFQAHANEINASRLAAAETPRTQRIFTEIHKLGQARSLGSRPAPEFEPDVRPGGNSAPSTSCSFKCTWSGCADWIGHQSSGDELGKDHALAHIALHRIMANENASGPMPCQLGDHPDLNCSGGMPTIEDIYSHMLNHKETSKPAQFVCSFPSCTAFVKADGFDTDRWALRHLDSHMNDPDASSTKPCSIPNCVVKNLNCKESFPSDALKYGQHQLLDHMYNHFQFRCTYPPINGKSCGQMIGMHQHVPGAGGKKHAIDHIEAHRAQIALYKSLAISKRDVVPAYTCTEKNCHPNLACSGAFPTAELVLQHMQQHESYGESGVHSLAYRVAHHAKLSPRKAATTKASPKKTAVTIVEIAKSPKKRQRGLNATVETVVSPAKKSTVISDADLDYDSVNHPSNSITDGSTSGDAPMIDGAATASRATRSGLRGIAATSPSKAPASKRDAERLPSSTRSDAIELEKDKRLPKLSDEYKKAIAAEYADAKFREFYCPVCFKKVTNYQLNTHRVGGRSRCNVSGATEEEEGWLFMTPDELVAGMNDDDDED